MNELKKLLSTELNNEQHYSVTELAHLLNEFAKADDSIMGSVSKLNNNGFINEASCLLDDHRIQQLITAERDEVFYLIPENDTILPRISSSMRLRYIENFDPMHASKLTALTWYSVLTEFEMNKDNAELVPFFFKKIISILLNSSFNHDSSPNGWLIEKLQLLVSQIMSNTEATDFIQKMTKECAALIQKEIHDCSTHLIQATKNHAWRDVVHRIDFQSNLLEYKPDPHSVGFTLLEAAHQQKWRVVQKIIDKPKILIDTESLCLTLEEATFHSQNAIVEKIICVWRQEASIQKAASKMMEDAAFLQKWKLVFFILSKLIDLKIETTTTCLEHTLEQAAKHDQRNIIHLILKKEASFNPASLVRALLFAEKNKHWHTVITLGESEGLATTAHKSISAAISTAKQMIAQENTPKPTPQSLFFKTPPLEQHSAHVLMTAMAELEDNDDEELVL